jgi:hypothetical protein
MICLGALQQLLFVYEAPAHRPHRDARHRPAGVYGRICGNLFPDVDGLPNFSRFAPWCVSGFLLP